MHAHEAYLRRGKQESEGLVAHGARIHAGGATVLLSADRSGAGDIGGCSDTHVYVCVYVCYM